MIFRHTCVKGRQFNIFVAILNVTIGRQSRKKLSQQIYAKVMNPVCSHISEQIEGAQITEMFE